MNDTTNALLPESYQKAADYLKQALHTRPLSVDGQENQQLLSDATVAISKGFNYQNWKPDASQDTLQITVTSPQLVNSTIADATVRTVATMLNEYAAVRDAAILVSPKEYLEQERKEVKELLEKAKQANIPGSDIDYSQAGLLNPNISRNQLQKYATQITDGPRSTDIRVNIPTNPENRDAASALAQKVADDLKRRLPEIKEQMIARMVEKNYIPDLTPEKIEKLKNHTFEVMTSQQGNWTSVFLTIRSPEQQEEHDKPGTHKDPETLKKTNMLMQIPDDQGRFKIAARGIMFQGDKLRQPASFFLDVAGSEDIKTGLTKVMNRLKAQSDDDIKAKIDALMNENFLKSPEQWNLPPEKQEDFKRSLRAHIDPDHPEIMKFTLPVAKGKGDEIVSKIAELGSNISTTMSGSATATATCTATASVTPGETAVSSTAAAIADGIIANQTKLGSAQGPATLIPKLKDCLCPGGKSLAI